MKKIAIIGGIMLIGAAAYGIIKAMESVHGAGLGTRHASHAAAREGSGARTAGRQAPKPDEIKTIERLLVQQGSRLARIDVNVDEGVSVVRHEIPSPPPLSGFYLRNVAERRGILLQHNAAGGSAEAPGMLSVYSTAIVHSSGSDRSVRLRLPNSGWEVFEIIPPDAGAPAEPAASPAAGEPPAANIPPNPHNRVSPVVTTVVREFEFSDGFMRRMLAQNDGWRLISGSWALNQHGGGMPGSDAEAVQNVQRAVNPFSVTGWAAPGNSGTLAFDTPTSHGDSYLVEARFFFGPYQPAPQPAAVRLAQMPVATFILAQGRLDERQAGIGWSSTLSQWVLCTRVGSEPWSVQQVWSERPFTSNWARVGLAIVEGHIAVAFLDGRELGRCNIGSMISGSFHVHTAALETGTPANRIEFDDVAARPLVPHHEHRGESVFLKSRNFASKPSADRSNDPIEFEYWAKATNAYLVASGTDAVLGVDGSRGITRVPLYGDFTYLSLPELPAGDYRFLVLAKPIAKEAGDKLAEFIFSKGEGGWRLPVGDPAQSCFTLEWKRENGVFMAKDAAGWQPLGPKHAGSAHLMIVMPGGAAFQPQQHELYSKSLWYELFEQAPTDWYWADGRFGMNTRWSCQPGWNFMGGRSGGLAATFSKAAYHGDQEIECFMALSMMLPANQHYYIRRDFGLSFCTDGRNLDSGYTLVFGGWSNTRTVLFKRGKEIASTDRPQFLFHPGVEHSQVHKLWWNFHFKKSGKRIVVMLNGQPMFDVEDPDPIEGGHLAFWTLGNGFVVSRVNIAAQRRDFKPETGLNAWPEMADSDSNGWWPIIPDGVIIREAGDTAVVENPLSGGWFAARTLTQANLSQTPILELPLRLDPDAKVNLHIEIGGRPCIVRVAAPVDGMTHVLGPAADAAFPLGRMILQHGQLDAVLLGEASVLNGTLRINLAEMLRKKGIGIEGTRQIWLTIGNSSNTDYLLAGFGGNHAGTKYHVGRPGWIANQ